METDLTEIPMEAQPKSSIQKFKYLHVFQDISLDTHSN